MSLAGSGMVRQALRDTGKAGEVLAAVQERLTGNAALSAWGRYNRLLEQAATGWERLKAAQSGVRLEVPEATASAEVRTARVRATNREVKPDEEATPSARRTGAEAESPSRQVRRAVGRGPRETLGLVEGELGQEDLSEPRRQDLQRRRFLLRRQIVLDERRRKNEEKSLNGPGLLEAFDSLNGLVQDALKGNLLGVARHVKTFAEGIELHEDIGGLNIGQKLAKAALGGSGPAAEKGEAPADLVKARLATPSLGLNAHHLIPTAGTPGAQAGSLATETAAAGGGGLLAKLAPSLLPALAIAAGVVTGAVLVGVALKTFGREVVGAADRLREISSARSQSGGTTQEVLQLKGLGLSPGEIAAAGARIRTKASFEGGDIFSLGAAARAGIKPLLPAEYGGEQDNAKILQQVIDRLHALRPAAGDARAASYQLLEARRLDAEAYLELANVSDYVYRQIKADSESAKGLFGDEESQAARDLRAEIGRLRDGWDRLKLTLASPFISDLAKDIGTLADASRKASEILRSNPGAVKVATDTALRGVLGNLPAGAEGAMRGLRRLLGQGQEEKKRESALDKNTAAVNRSADSMDKLREGFLRGGAGANDALPAGLRREALRQALKLGTLRKRKV